MICKMKIALVDQPLCKTTAPLDDSDHLQKKYRRWEENMLLLIHPYKDNDADGDDDNSPHYKHQNTIFAAETHSDAGKKI